MTSDAAGGSGSPHGTTRWDRFLYWAGRFYATSDFDEIERNYKLVITERIQAAKDGLLAGDSRWVDQLNHAVTSKPKKPDELASDPAALRVVPRQPRAG
jgi:hypothetical protein